MNQKDQKKDVVMSTITKTLALAAFIGVLGISGFAFAKTQEATHRHPAQVEHDHAQQSNEPQATDIPSWSINRQKSGTGSNPPPGASGR
jgi:hypothetical protein